MRHPISYVMPHVKPSPKQNCYSNGIGLISAEVQANIRCNAAQVDTSFTVSYYR